ncbi:MAG: glycosyltransferase family 4 protein [Flavobacteriaceae bacterium]
MKVLWVVYSIFPDFSKTLGITPPVGGGWMYGLAKDLKEKGVSLTVVTARTLTKKKSEVIDGITYHLLPATKDREKYDISLVPEWKKIIEEVQPDVVHIHGTEYALGLSLMDACPNLRYVASIQGMTSVYARYFLGGISRREIYSNYTFRDFIRRDSPIQGQRKFEDRGKKIEIPYIKRIQNIIGRTQWDHDHASTINPKTNYLFCNESLRDSFYEAGKWRMTQENQYSIFVSQAGYPLKGLHKVLEAVAIIKDEFPQIKLRVARNNITKSDTFFDRLRLKGYGKYLKKLIKRHNLEDIISFTGPLDEQQMVNQYLNSHIFICPSSIENSPNSLGEAQLLGVPCIASYVGGVPDMVAHRKTGLLYRFEEVEMLAQSIKDLFSNSDLCESLSSNGIIEASKRHNKDTNSNRLIEIYGLISKKQVST